jgi:hypothetical protein
MALLFCGREKLQEGRGIGGILKSLPNLFKPKEKKEEG